MKNLKKIFSALLLSSLVCSMSRCNPHENTPEPGINFESPAEVAPSTYYSTSDELGSTWYTDHNALPNLETSVVLAASYVTPQRTNGANQYVGNYLDVETNLVCSGTSDLNGTTCIGHVR